MTMKLKLTYFNIRGLAETARILFAIGGEEYEDFRYPLEIIDMSKYEMNKEEFEKDKEDGKLFFKNLTMAPIEKDLINLNLLTTSEKNYLFKYHMEVYLKISKYLKQNEKKWLASHIQHF